MSEKEAESEAPTPIITEANNEAVEIKSEHEEEEETAVPLQNDDAPPENDESQPIADTSEALPATDSLPIVADLPGEPQDGAKSEENPKVEVDSPAVVSKVEEPARKDSNEVPPEKDSDEVQPRKDSKELSIGKDSHEEPTEKDPKQVDPPKESNEAQPRKDSNEVQARKDSKGSNEVPIRKSSAELPTSKDSHEDSTPKDSQQVQPRKDSEEKQPRKDSNEVQTRKDSKELLTSKDSNEQPARKDSKDDSNIAAVSDAQKTDAERKQSNVSDKGEPIDQSNKINSDPDADVDEEIQKMIKELADPEADLFEKKEKQPEGKETTENLISVLEDGIDQSKEKPPIEPKPETSTAATSETPVKPPKPKKYLYKLKSKTGKILHYTSPIPITLKRPVIHLTKMEDPRLEAAPKVIDLDKEEVDSDNSSKENRLKENEAPNDNVMSAMKKKSRPPLSTRPPPPVITLDGNSSDTQDSFKNKSAPSFSMQTRKRQLKFLPDGRLLPPQKRMKNSSSSDSDIDIIFSEGEQTDRTPIPAISRVEIPAKKFKTEIKPMITSSGDKRKYKKVFDFESYYREKTGVPPPASLVRSQANKTFTSSLTPIRKLVDTPRPKLISPAPCPASKKTSSVDPAQLLSSLIGVPISANQLNVVKFKPKVIQERTNNIIASTPKKVTFEDDKTKKFSANQSELLKSTPFKIVSKPTYQKILPKPTGMDKPPIMQNRMAYQQVAIDNKFTPTVPSTSLFVAATSPFLRESLNETLSKFETFTDSKVVKTKGGPRRALKRKHTEEEGALKDSSPKTIYDLMYDIFDKMPSWNLHLIPDNNCFCIAQVSRGRMGIPTLKKSIELNSEFFAKVYVHQLHCKRYDGIYDTESKIIKLIKEIDALAA